MERREWAILYADGSVFTNLDGPPENAPRQGVQIVYNLDPNVGLREEQTRVGFWGWRDAYGWVAFQTESGFWDYAFESGIRQITLFGRTLPESEWWALRATAVETAMNAIRSGILPRHKGIPDGP